MAVPSFVGVEEGRNATPEGTTSLSVAVPSGSAGDLLIAVVGVKDNPSTTTPQGFTPIIAGFNGCTSGTDTGYGIRAQLSAWWKIADGSETAISVSFGPNPRQAAGAVLRYAGTDPTTPIGESACDKGSSASPTAPSVNTVSADNRVVRLVVADGDQARSLFTAEPATKRFELASTSVFGPGSSYSIDAVVVAGSDAAQAAAGATGTAAWTLPSLDQWAAITLAIQPPADGAGQSGCAELIVRIIRIIIAAILAALRRLFEWLKGLLGRRRRRATKT
jgi:hypothetical protein